MPEPKQAPQCPDFVEMLASRAPGPLTEQIVRCFSKQLEKKARFHCEDSTLAEDAFQETIKNVLLSIHRFRGDASIETWLAKLVTSACSRLRRGRKNNPRYNLPLDHLPVHAEVDASFQDREVREHLSQRLELLSQVMLDVPEPNRTVFLLHEGQEIPLAELAERFHLTIDGLKGRLKRTRRFLRRRLLEIATG